MHSHDSIVIFQWRRMASCVTNLHTLPDSQAWLCLSLHLDKLCSQIYNWGLCVLQSLLIYSVDLWTAREYWDSNQDDICKCRKILSPHLKWTLVNPKAYTTVDVEVLTCGMMEHFHIRQENSCRGIPLVAWLFLPKLSDWFLYSAHSEFVGFLTHTSEIFEIT